ncbi:hypothetical protein ADUPG1_000790 [Aduncisulcus paluster]|uniref:Uncharacterized protein n=1 Tax=Aduncisulcus paluster TaxID=2918883 RepID=A0ABQ5KBT0_9EUKA|nr:hypothetical protein ADUPG1_000790 [Aduncisulcus paluster]
MIRESFSSLNDSLEEDKDTNTLLLNFDSFLSYARAWVLSRPSAPSVFHPSKQLGLLRTLSESFSQDVQAVIQSELDSARGIITEELIRIFKEGGNGSVGLSVNMNSLPMLSARYRATLDDKVEEALTARGGREEEEDAPFGLQALKDKFSAR